MPDELLARAEKLLERAVISRRGKPVGLAAAAPKGELSAPNYQECFVRDFAVAGFWFLAEGRGEIVRGFLETILALREEAPPLEGFEIRPGVMPASFRILKENDGLVGDFGDRAIGRVAPVDSMMWWLLLLRAYTASTGDRSLLDRDDCRDAIRKIISLCLGGSFEIFPTLLVPDAAFMIDRRMGVYGHPLEIQSLFYGMLGATLDGLREAIESDQAERIDRRRGLLRKYVRRNYWLAPDFLEAIHGYKSEAFGSDAKNFLNIRAESIPDGAADWIPEDAGYFAGNLGAERLDTRFFAQGNLLAALFGLTDKQQTAALMELYDKRWDDLTGKASPRLCFPALEEAEWRLTTGCDPKNRPWSYHNGGCWPVLVWPLVAAALRSGRRDLAERAYEQFSPRTADDGWPEYYEGRAGDRIGERANLNQVWSASALLLARRLLDDEGLLKLFPGNAPDEDAPEDATAAPDANERIDNKSDEGNRD